MSGKISYDLQGSVIKIKHHDSKLSVDGDHPELYETPFSANVKADKIAIGQLITVVLLPCARNGDRVTLSVPLPEVVFEQNRDRPATAGGVAILTRHHDRLLNPSPVAKDYDAVFELSGSASRIRS